MLQDVYFCRAQIKSSYESDNTTKGSYPVNVNSYDNVCCTTPHKKGSTKVVTLLQVQHLSKLSDNTTNKDIRFRYVTNLVMLVNVVTVQRGRKIQFLVDNIK